MGHPSDNGTNIPFFSFLFWLITFANSLDPDQARLFVGPDLDRTVDTLIVFLKEFFEKVNFEKIRRQKITKNYPACKELQTENKFP